MSYQASDWAVAQPIDNPAAKLVLLILAHHMNHKTGQCFPSIATMARESGLSDRGVRNAIARLVKLGLVELRGGRTRRHYHLNLSTPAPRTDVSRETPVPGAAIAADNAARHAENAAPPATTVAAGAGRSGTPCRLTGKEQGNNREGENREKPGGALIGPAGALSPINAAGMEKTRTPAQSATRANRQAAATRLPTDWQPSPDGIAFARREHPAIDWQRELGRFRDYWLAKPGRSGESADWQASWRRWLAHAERFAPRPKSGASPPPFVPSPLGEPWHRRVQCYQEQRFWLSDWGTPPGSPSGCRVPNDVLHQFGYPTYERQGSLVPALDAPADATNPPDAP